MKKYSIVGGALLAVVIVAGLFYSTRQTLHKNLPSKQVTDPLLTTVPKLTDVYTNDRYHFSFKLPTSAKTTFREYGKGKDTLAVEYASSTGGFQIDIQAIDEDVQALTVEKIKHDLPDIQIESPQDVLLGAGGKGVAFLSDDPAFGGKSREVWFVYKKTLYQIRTYETYDKVLQAVLSTWEFK